MASFSPLHLRRRWQAQMPFRNAMYPFLVLYIAINIVWIAYDTTITANEHHRPKRETIQVTESSPLTPFCSSGTDYVGFRRAFPIWTKPFPCGPLESDRAMQQQRRPATEGLLYVRELEASTVEFSSITARLARRMGQKQQQIASIADQTNATANVCTTRLLSQRGIRYRERIPEKSFLWSVVREPVSRLVSKYYHFGHLHGLHGTALKTTDAKFRSFLINNLGQDYGYYFKSLGVNYRIDPQLKKHEADTREILESYDFLGVSERMDETLAVLKIILNLEINDVLYLSIPKATTRENVDYYDMFGKDNCRAVLKPEVPLELKEWFYSEDFEALIEADVMFYKAVNASLDKTIDELGRDLVEATVKQIQQAQKVAQKECSHVRFPCSSEGVLQEDTDCLFGNIGCGYKCLDQLDGKLLPS